MLFTQSSGVNHTPVAVCLCQKYYYIKFKKKIERLCGRLSITHLLHCCNLLGYKQLLEKHTLGAHCTVCEQNAAPQVFFFLQLQQINVSAWKNT